MAPPTPFKTEYDQDIKKHVVQVRDNTTGEFKKFFYNHEYQRFEAVSDPVVVYEKDLEPLYQSECQRHSRIVFCANKKLGGKIFKYLIGSSRGPWQKVQCLCCHFQSETVDKEWANSMKMKMSPTKTVDDDNYNCLWFQPVFSKFCQKSGKISVFASIYPNQDQLSAWNFDIQKENFVRSECKNACCKEVVLSSPVTPKAFDFGSQGLYFARTHRDQAGRPLICLAITWFNKEHGQMEIFMDADGDIGKYEWNEKLQCFTLVKNLDARCLNHTNSVDVARMNKTLWYDDGLRLLYSQECPTLNETIFFCWHEKDGKTRKYLFNPVCLQFSLIKCTCCQYSTGVVHKYENAQIALYTSYTTNTEVVIKRKEEGVLVKELITYLGNRITMQPSPIRIDSHLHSHELLKRRDIERNISSMAQIFTAEGFEGWVIRNQRTSFDGRTAIGTIALMNGSVKPFSLDCEQQNYAIYNKDCIDLSSKSTKTNSFVPPNTERFALDWDLSPKKLVRCSHSKQQVMIAFNHFTQKEGYYVFNSDTGHFVEIQRCDIDECEQEEVKISPTQALFGTISVLSTRAIIISTNEEGRLMKIGEDPRTKIFSGMIPLRILTQKDLKNALSSVKLEEHTRINQVDLMENYSMFNLHEDLEKSTKKVAAVEKEKMSLEKTVQELEQELAKMKLVVEEQKVEKKEEESRDFPIVKAISPSKPAIELTDYDLTPTYRNFCPHTGHFYITAINNIDKSIGHYIFNPDTALFHHQKYCFQCPNYTKGVKIQPFVTIMPVDTKISSFPYLVMTNDSGRMVKIGFDPKIKGFVSMNPTKIQEAVYNIRDITNSVKETDAIQIPTENGGPYDCNLVPKFRVFCSHSSEFFISGYHKSLKTEGFYAYNPLSGHLEERADCKECRQQNPIYVIEPLRSIMPVVSPYSRWPIMLTTDRDGSFVPIGFQIDTFRFDKMPPLRIFTLKSEEVPAEVKQEDVVLETKTEDLEIKTEDLETKTEDLETKTEDLEIKTEDLEIKTEDLEIKTEDLEIKTEDLEIKTEEVQSVDNVNVAIEDTAAKEEEEKEVEEKNVEERKPDSTIHFEKPTEVRPIRLSSSTGVLKPDVSVHYMYCTPTISDPVVQSPEILTTEQGEEEEEDCSDEESYCCSDEECDCDDEECSDEESDCDDEECSDEECDCDDEECSDEECCGEDCFDEEDSDDEYSDEECSDEECCDEECSDEECSDEECDCSDDECKCEDEEDNDNKPEDENDSEAIRKAKLLKDVAEVIELQNRIMEPFEFPVKLDKPEGDQNSLLLKKKRKSIEVVKTDDVNVPEVLEYIYNFDRVDPLTKYTSEVFHKNFDSAREDDVESTATAMEDDVESVATAIEDDVESVATAIEDDVEFTATALEEDREDVESTATAIEDDLESISNDVVVVDLVNLDDTISSTASSEQSGVSPDDSDVEIIDSAIVSEPKDESSISVNEPKQDYSEDVFDDAESTTTAVEPSDDESDVSHVDAEPDCSDSESVATALEPEEDEDDISIISSTSTAREFSIPNDSGSSMGSDISYLDSDLGSVADENDVLESEMVKSTYEDASDEQPETEEEELKEEEPAAPVPSNPCTIS